MTHSFSFPPIFLPLVLLVSTGARPPSCRPHHPAHIRTVASRDVVPGDLRQGTVSPSFFVSYPFISFQGKTHILLCAHAVRHCVRLPPRHCPTPRSAVCSMHARNAIVDVRFSDTPHPARA
ncbi:hypothetical protein GGX14DRAFT_467542 [Mycena pura]|uniref:Secreted protein n=1 Tax=Mycena pura TaxID=153505 RepID=A0AAD6V0Y4_9AGAR|nr:hypothetical protein GGX14DRAFT_467542 [Mycena pura]